jgi:serine/threonine protein kinase
LEKAPEMVTLRSHQGGYGRPVDCWALGVILYIMYVCRYKSTIYRTITHYHSEQIQTFLFFICLCRLSGIHPFQIEEDEEKMLDLIESGKWKWLGPHWTNVSEAAKDLITKLMEPNPEKRFTVKQALQHPWILVPFYVLETLFSKNDA